MQALGDHAIGTVQPVGFFFITLTQVGTTQIDRQIEDGLLVSYTSQALKNDAKHSLIHQEKGSVSKLPLLSSLSGHATFIARMLWESVLLQGAAASPNSCNLSKKYSH